MSALFKLAPPGPAPGGGQCRVPGVEGGAKGWRKAIAVGGEGGGGDGTRPPLAPSRFAAQLEEKKFTNNADLKVVCDLVRRAPAHCPRRTRPSQHFPPTPLHSTSKRYATASARAGGWRTGVADGATRRRRSWG